MESEIPLHDGPNDDSIVIPARCEVLKVKLQENATGTRLIDSHELVEGVMIARTIISSIIIIIKEINNQTNK